MGKIRAELISLSNQLDRAQNEANGLHLLDIEVMLSKTRRLYEFVLQLDADAQSQRSNASSPTADELTKEAVAAPLPDEIEFEIKGLPNTVVQHDVEGKNIAETAFFIEPDEIEAVHEFETDIARHDESVETSSFHSPSTINDAEPTMAENLFEETVVNQESHSGIHEKTELFVSNESFAQNPSFSPTRKTVTSKTTLDLFGANLYERVADRFGEDSDNSIAARIERSKFTDLRMAIGINEKFLFINELFEGNTTAYNKVIDELNTFQSLNGAKTHLIELSVQFQWPQDSVAKEKLSRLVERKFEA